MEARACFRLGSQVRAGFNIGVTARIHRSSGYRLALPSEPSAESVTHLGLWRLVLPQLVLVLLAASANASSFTYVVSAG